MNLVRLVEGVKGGRRRDHHPATQVFQALRIAVNQELDHWSVFSRSVSSLAAARTGAWRLFRFIRWKIDLVKRCFSQMEPRLFLSAAGAGLPVRLESEGETADQKTAGAVGELKFGSQPARPSAKLRAVERV